MRFLTAVLLLYGMSAHAVFAQVAITEIMYDIPGSDSRREWIEIQNVGREPIDISSWRFYEGDTNHRLTPVSGGTVLNPQGYAIVADNAERFLADWQNFTGMLFDSSFSLKNTSETLILRNSELHDVNVISYNSAWGGDGNGYSLQLVDGEWKQGEPTPGKANRESALPVVKEKVVKVAETITPEPHVAVVANKEKSDGEEETIAGVIQVAAVAEGKLEENGDMFRWILALIGVLGVGAVAAIIFRRERPQDEIKILE